LFRHQQFQIHKHNESIIAKKIIIAGKPTSSHTSQLSRGTPGEAAGSSGADKGPSSLKLFHFPRGPRSQVISGWMAAQASKERRCKMLVS